jgi:hypothetical protein
MASWHNTTSSLPRRGTSCGIRGTTPTYTFGGHALTVGIIDVDGLSYAGSLAITVGN